MAIDLAKVSDKNLMATIERLDGMGIRFAGTRGEKRSANWIEQSFSKFGLENIHQQEFPCLTFDFNSCVLQAELNGRWEVVASEPAAHSPGTSQEGIHAPLVVVEKVPGSVRECRALFGRKAVLMYNSELFQLSVLRRVMSAKPAALLVVDDRFPCSWTVAVGFPRYWIDFIECPIVNVAYTDAWEIVRSGVNQIRLALDTRMSEAFSQNVIGEIPGSNKNAEVLIISAHHDSVINNPGADDNCSGVAAVVELARVFSGSRPKRTLRFISYGTEEQLSEGARHYAENCPDLNRIRFVLNIDAIGAWMGKTGIYHSGPPSLVKTLKEVSKGQTLQAHFYQELSPFSDHFPLNFCGIPIAWYYRTTYVAARHFHHSRLETPEVISPVVLRETVMHQAAVLDRLANCTRMPFPRNLPANQMKRLRRMAKEWCGID
jgi:hypothetical protein